VHVLGLEFEQLGKRFRHGLEAATEVELHGVLRWRRGDDHVGVAGCAGDLLELLGQTGADTRRTERCADVEPCQLRDPGPEVWHDDSDANQPSAVERTESDPALVDVILERLHLGFDGMFAVTVRVPGRRAEVAVPRHELCAVLLVEHVDAFPTVDLGDARQLGPAQLSDLDCRFHRLTIAHGRPAPQITGTGLPCPVIEHLFNLALAEDWERAPERDYETSTLGVSLSDQGFIHRSFRHQVQQIADVVYRGRNDVLLLKIDHDRLSAQIKVEALHEGEDAFPHIYRPLNRPAVVESSRMRLLADGRLDASGAR